MTTFTALTTVDGKEAAYALSEAMERVDPEPLGVGVFCLLYTSPSPRDRTRSRMPSSA